MISFERSISLEEIEGTYAALLKDDSSVLRLPHSLHLGGGTGVVGGLIQFVATWSRERPTSTLRTFGSDGAGSAARLVEQPYGLAAAYFARQIADQSGKPVSKQDVLSRAATSIAAMQAMHLRHTTTGRAAFLACIAGAHNEYIAPLYSMPKAGAVRGRDDFYRLTNELVQTCAPPLARRLTDVDRIGLATLVFELFKNTDEHAAKDLAGRPYSWQAPNIRGIYARFVTALDASQLSVLVGHDYPLQLFLARSILEKRKHVSVDGTSRSGQSASFLELTIFDTGPGLAKRWWAKYGDGRPIDQLSVEDEKELVVQCFRLHSTTKEGTGSGIGLDSVVNALRRLGGFLRLRTGRLCLCQDFSSKRTSGLSLQHWDKARPTLQQTSGASYSIFIPATRELS